MPYSSHGLWAGFYLKQTWKPVSIVAPGIWERFQISAKRPITIVKCFTDCAENSANPLAAG
jgi:hypothetical protein